MTDDILSEIDAYCAKAGISPTTLGRLAGQGGTFYTNLRSGKRSWPETIAKVRAYMAANPPVPKNRSGAA